MPFISDPKQQIADRRLIPVAEYGDDPKAMDVALSLYRTENTIGSLVSRESGLPDNIADQSFNPWDHFTEDEKLDSQFISNAAMADTVDEINAVRRQVQRERKDRQTIADGGAMSFGLGVAVGTLDPVNIIPIGGAIAKTYKAGNSILSGAMVTGSIASASTAIQEAALHSTQLERTYGESAINMSAAFLLGGVLGAGGAKLKQIADDKIIKEIADSMDVEPKIARGEDTLMPVTVLDEAQAKTDFISQAKEDLLGLAGNKMSRGERKALESEAKVLQERIGAIKSVSEEVAPVKGVSARAAKKKAVQAGDELAAQERQTLQEQLDVINNRLDADQQYRNAESNLSRLEQGIIPDDMKSDYDSFLQENKIAYERTDYRYKATVNIDGEETVIEGGVNDIRQLAADEGISPSELSVGAAQVLQGVAVKGKVGKFLTKMFAFDPLSRTITSESPVVRQIANQLAENPIAMDGGITTAAESLAKLHDGKYASALQSHRDLYSKYLEARSTATQRAGMKVGVGVDGVMNIKQFNEAVARAMRDGKHEIPEVLQSAQSWRKELYDPLKDEMIAVGLLPEDVEVSTAVDYLNRRWNKRKVASQMPSFIDKVSKWLEEQDVKLFKEAAQAAQDIKTAEGAEAKRLQKIIDRAEFKEGKDLDVNDYEDIARQIAGRIMGTPDGRLPYDWKMGDGSSGGKLNGSKSVKGPLKSRTFQIPDSMVEEFLDNDIEDLGRLYLRQTAMDIELTRKFGSIDLQSEIDEIQKWYTLAQKNAKSEKEALAIDKRRVQDIKDVRDMRDRLRGVYGNVDPDNPWVRAGRVARNLNYMRFMGGVVPSSVPDVARIFMAEGIVNTFKHGIRPLAANLKQFKVSAAEAKRYGVGIDALMGGRSQIISDVADYTQAGTAFERGLQSMTDNFGRINMMDYWTSGVKQLHAVTMQNSVIDGLLKGKIDKRLARLGIDEANARNIAEELKKHAEKVDGVWLSNAKNWDVPELERLWGAAIRKESDRVIVVPGQEKPLFMSGEMGKTVLQFKSFMFSSTQRMLIASMQGQDHNAMAGMLMLTSLGMMSYAFKQWNSDREIADNPVELVVEGIDRSGALGGLMEINNTMEKLSSNNFGMRPLLGVEVPAARFASRSMSENLLGPTFGSFLDTSLRVANAGLSEDGWDEKDTRAMRRLLPYQNLVYLRKGFDLVEKKIGDL